MTAYLGIGTEADYAGTTVYNFWQKADDHIYLRMGGRLPERPTESGMLASYDLMIKGSSEANIIAQEKLIRDLLRDAINFCGDSHESEAVFLWDYAENETPKKAIIEDGALIAITERETDASLAWTRCLYRLEIYHGSWESVSETTGLNAVTFSGGTVSSSISSVKGDDYGRISQLLVRATSTNEEDEPLDTIFIGLRPEYDGYTSFDPIVDVSMSGTLENDTSVISVDDSNTFPVGSSSNNAIEVAFADTELERRAILSFRDVVGLELVTNPGAETGDLTGWTNDPANDINWSAQTDQKVSGTYSFKCIVDESTGDYTGQMTQNIVAEAGHQYSYSFWVLNAGMAGNIRNIISIKFLDSGGGTITTHGILYSSSVAGHPFLDSWTKFSGYVTAPSTCEYIQFYVWTNAGLDGYVATWVDDFSLKDLSLTHYRGSYIAAVRAKMSGTAGDADIALKFGYTGSNYLPNVGRPQKVTNSDWMIIPVGEIDVTPGRNLGDESSIWRMANLGFEIWAQKISGTVNLWIDSILLIPSKHFFKVKGCEICRSSWEIASEEFMYADLDARISVYDEPVIISDSSDFLGINSGIEQSVANWNMPDSNCLAVAFAQQSSIHDITDQFNVTLKYYARYMERNTD